MKSTPALSFTLLGSAFAAPTKPQHAANGITFDPSVAADKSFDYIVAGGGLTGLTVASRLTEDPSISVLVIETGRDNHEDSRINDVRTYGEAFNSELDHGIHSTPVESQNGSGLLVAAGKTLGGSGSINGASWTKGPRLKNFRITDADEVKNGAQWIESAHARGGPVQASFAEGLFDGIPQPALEASEQV